MHERSLIAGLLRRIEDAGAAAGSDRVVGVTVRAGALAGISADHLRAHFDLASRGTIAEGAGLIVEVDTDPADSRALHLTLTHVEVATLAD